MSVFQIPSVSTQWSGRPSDVTPRVAPELPLPHLGVNDEGLIQPRRWLNAQGRRQLWGWAPPDHPASLAVVVVVVLVLYLMFMHRGKK